MALVKPEIFADAVNDRVTASCKILNVLTDVTNAVPELATAGNKVNFPRYDRLTGLVNTVTQGVELVPTEVSMTNNEADVIQAAGTIRVYDTTEIQVKGSTMDAMAQQLADAISLKYAVEMGKACDAQATMKSAQADANAFTYDEYLSALSLFGDSQDTDSFAGIVINSLSLPSLYKMDAFTSTEKTFQTMGNGIVKAGLCGFLAGVPVFLDNSASYDSTNKEVITRIVKKNSVGIARQQDIKVEYERLPKLLCTDITASTLFAERVLDKSGIVLMKKTIA